MKQYTDARMHTAEHILNQTMVRMFDCGRCFSSHIEKKKSKCDYHFDRALTQEERSEIEKRINAVIRQDLPVTEELLSREEAEARFSLERLPGSAGERIRIVEVGDYDACPCIGRHVTATARIGGVRITTSDYHEGVLRLRFRLAAG